MAELWRKLFVLFFTLVIVHEISCQDSWVCNSGVIKKHGGCAGHPHEDIYTCIVPNVYSIVDVYIHNNNPGKGGPGLVNCTYHPGAIPSNWTAAMGGVYTFSGNTITVAGGCRAVFEVEYDACVNVGPPSCIGTIRRHGCSAYYDSSPHECPVPNVEEILDVFIFNMVSNAASCKYYAPGTLTSTWTPADGGAYSFTNSSVLMAGGCRAVVDICVSDPPTACEHGEGRKMMKYGGCARQTGEEYYNCSISHVYSIISVGVHQLTTQTDTCTQMFDVPFDWDPANGGVFAFHGNVIEVAGGCRAVFEAEFDACVNDNPPPCEGGEWKRQPCTAMYTDDYNVCTVPNIGELLYVSIFNKVTVEDCVFYPPPIHTNWNASFGGAYTFYGNQIFVAGGCRAVFDVCGSARPKCTLHGDPHVTTFDKKHFGLPGVCTFILFQYAGLTIVGETHNCFGGRFCLKSVTIHHEGLAIKIAHNHKLYVNGVEVLIPYYSADVDVTTTNSGHSFAMMSDMDISVTWDGKNSAEIEISDIYMGLIKGICGNANLDEHDDFKTPTGDIVNRIDFANSWRTDESCSGSLV